MDLNQNRKNIYQEDEIDLFELGKKIWSYKKLICIVASAVTALAVLYAFATTPMYQATALVETGFYRDDGGAEKMIASTSDSIQKLTITYIDLLKDVEGLEYRVKKISEVKNNNKFLNIEVLATSNKVAIEQINKMVNGMASEHQNTLNAHLETKKIQLANIDRQINFLKNNIIVEKQEQIEYVKSIQIPRIDRQIVYMQEATIPAAKRDLLAIDNVAIPTIEKQIELNSARLKKYESELEKLQVSKGVGSSENIILRQMMEQGLYNQISNLEQSIISLEQQKDILTTQTKPNAQDRLDRLTSVELENMQAEKDTIISDKLPALQRELANLQTEELNKLLDQRSLIELALKPYNYQNTQIVSEIVTSDKPTSPKKALIVAIAFLTGLMISVFGVLIYDSIKSRINKE